LLMGGVLTGKVLESLRRRTNSVLVLLGGGDSEPDDLYESYLGNGLADGYTSASSMKCSSWGMRLLEMYDHAVQNRRVESVSVLSSKLDEYGARQEERHKSEETLLRRAEKLCNR